MRPFVLLLRPLVFVLPIACGAAAPPASRAPLPSAEARCLVWDRELGFARAVHDHDAAAFAEHVARGALFVDDEGLTRGREAITKAWGSLIEGTNVHLTWYPTDVTLTGDGRQALSRGPYWAQVDKPGSERRFLTGSFQSVWILDDDGVWRVLVDGGTPPAKPATEVDVRALEQTRPPRCPAAPG